MRARVMQTKDYEALDEALERWCDERALGDPSQFRALLLTAETLTHRGATHATYGGTSMDDATRVLYVRLALLLCRATDQLLPETYRTWANAFRGDGHLNRSYFTMGVARDEVAVNPFETQKGRSRFFDVGLDHETQTVYCLGRPSRLTRVPYEIASVCTQREADGRVEEVVRRLEERDA